jgi:hypothetical protein
MWVKVESMRLDWYSLPKHQKIIHVELYRGIVDTLQAGEARAAKVGRRVILPRNFDGSERSVKAHFLDAMTLVLIILYTFMEPYMLTTKIIFTSVSCSLFILKFFELWSGDKLSVNITQVNVLCVVT